MLMILQRFAWLRRAAVMHAPTVHGTEFLRGETPESNLIEVHLYKEEARCV
jgi:hypothetical protein